jgi:hypothetical protein
LRTAPKPTISSASARTKHLTIRWVKPALSAWWTHFKVLVAHRTCIEYGYNFWVSHTRIISHV